MEDYLLKNEIGKILKLLNNGGKTTLIYESKVEFNNFISEFKNKAINFETDKSFEELSNIKKLERIFDELKEEEKIKLLKRIKNHLSNNLNDKLIPIDLNEKKIKIIKIIDHIIENSKIIYFNNEEAEELINEILKEQDFKIKKTKLATIYKFIDKKRKELKKIFTDNVVENVFKDFNNKNIRHNNKDKSDFSELSEKEFYDLLQKTSTFIFYLNFPNKFRELKMDIKNNNKSNKKNQNEEKIFFIDGAISSNKNKVGLIAIVDNKGKLLYKKENSDCEWATEIEAFAFLKLVKYLVKNKILNSFVYEDNNSIISWFNKKNVKSKSKAKEYMEEALNLIDENKLNIKMEYIISEKNLADKYTREI